MLKDCSLIGFAPTQDFQRARAFYADTLGLPLVKDDGFALVFECAGVMLRVVRAEDLEPQPFTIVGWEVNDLQEATARLTQRGVRFERFGAFEQDAQGVWTAPNGDQVAWFKDPDGNLLSISHHV